MIPCEVFYDALSKTGISFFTGVPDSFLKDMGAYIRDHAEAKNHIITPNEGTAIALASGYHLATGKLPLVYMQNSGLGNALNPLTSLADREVYSIPLLLLIGWRGEPGVPDEPQHRKKGRITPALLETLDIPYCILDRSETRACAQLEEMATLAIQEKIPVALLVRKETFAAYHTEEVRENGPRLSCERAIQILLPRLPEKSALFSTTGYISRMLNENKVNTQDCFYNVGAMGHVSAITLGADLQFQEGLLFCLDGDGSALMHMGAIPLIAKHASSRFKHIIFNNGAHLSVGGQPTLGFDFSLPEVARACGYGWTKTVAGEDELQRAIQDLIAAEGPCLLEIRVNQVHSKDLSRPKDSLGEVKARFMEFLRR
jgi:phosphonopyruvate decarboxylase